MKIQIAAGIRTHIALIIISLRKLFLQLIVKENLLTH